MSEDWGSEWPPEVYYKLTRGRSGGGSQVFDPLSASPYVYFSFNPSYLFQGLAGATPVTAAGQSIASMLNLGSAGGYGEQGVAGSRPVYGTAGGKYWGEFDGSDDWLQIDSLLISRPYAVYAALRPTSAFFSRFVDALDDLMVLPDGNISGGTIPFSLADAFSASIVSAIPITPGNDYVISAHVLPNGQNSKFSVNNESWVTGNLQSTGGMTSLAMMADVGGGAYAGGRVYGLGVFPVPSDAVDAQLYAHFAGLLP